MPKEIKFNQSDITTVSSLYLAGTSCKQIGKQFNCSKQTINKILRENNVELRDQSHCHQKYQIDENIFENIDTQEKAYWLGILTGDGWVTDRNEFGLSLQEKDKDHIDIFKIFLNSTHPIKIYKNRNKKDGSSSISHALKINNQKIVSDLKKYGIKPNKTLNIEFPNISDEFLASYMLGLVDSDGSIYLKNHYKKDIKLLNFNFIGPTEFVEKFQEKLIKHCQVSKTKLGTQKHTNFVRTVEYAGYKNIYKIIRFLYSNSTIYLSRKKDIGVNYLLTKYPNDQWLIDQYNLRALK